MSSIRRRFAVLVSSAAMMAFMAVGASGAQAFEIQDPRFDEPCPAVSLSGTTVSGGCLIEDMEGTFAILSNGSVVNTFDANFDMRIDSAGKFYAVDQWVGPNQPGFSRQQCDDPVSHDPIPWSGTAVGGMQMTMCLEASSGQGGFSQNVTFKNSYGPFGEGYSFLGMTQTNSPTVTGIANADFLNGGWSDEEIRIILA